jgi:alpha-ribazole phosphatase
MVQPLDFDQPSLTLYCWRHPRAKGAAGRCIGHTDLAVDPRKAKRLAHRIRQHARRHQLQFEVTVSPLRRSHDVGRWLQRWGWQVRVDARVAEMNFGDWDGKAWTDIAWAEVQTWQDDFLHHAPGGGESLWQLAQRVQAVVNERLTQAALSAVPMHGQFVTHGGWINALLHVPPQAQQFEAASWPAPPKHGALRCWAPTQ